MVLHEAKALALDRHRAVEVDALIHDRLVGGGDVGSRASKVLRACRMSQPLRLALIEHILSHVVLVDELLHVACQNLVALVLALDAEGLWVRVVDRDVQEAACLGNAVHRPIHGAFLAVN